jgi:hypothetical protein
LVLANLMLVAIGCLAIAAQ